MRPVKDVGHAPQAGPAPSRTDRAPRRASSWRVERLVFSAPCRGMDATPASLNFGAVIDRSFPFSPGALGRIHRFRTLAFSSSEAANAGPPSRGLSIVRDGRSQTAPGQTGGCLWPDARYGICTALARRGGGASPSGRGWRWRSGGGGSGARRLPRLGGDLPRSVQSLPYCLRNRAVHWPRRSAAGAHTWRSISSRASPNRIW